MLLNASKRAHCKDERKHTRVPGMSNAHQNLRKKQKVFVSDFVMGIGGLAQVKVLSIEFDHHSCCEMKAVCGRALVLCPMLSTGQM